MSIIGAAIGAAANTINGIFDRKNQRKLQQMSIDAQREANEANIASQEKINKANVDMQREINQANIDSTERINNIMRHDAKHAISDKKTDLQRAGYSTADPNQTGFSAASLTAPSLGAATQVAPHVEPTFNQQGVANAIASRRSSVQNLTDLMQTLADIKLKDKQGKNIDTDTDSKKVDTDIKKIDLEWKGAEYYTRISSMYNTIDNIAADTSVKKETVNKLKSDVSVATKQCELLGEQVEQMKFTNKTNEERFRTEMENLKASIYNLRASADLSTSQKEINVFKKRVAAVEATMSEHGVSFNGGSFVDAILRLSVAPNGSELMTQLQDFTGEVIDGSLNTIMELPERIFKGIVRGGKEAIRKHLSH